MLLDEGLPVEGEDHNRDVPDFNEAESALYRDLQKEDEQRKRRTLEARNLTMRKIKNILEK
jgi:hypothetical protein